MIGTEIERLARIGFSAMVEEYRKRNPSFLDVMASTTWEGQSEDAKQDWMEIAKAIRNEVGQESGR